MTAMQKGIILAIESAIRGGSISLINGDIEIGSWLGEKDTSRAEDLLINISNLLERYGISKDQVDLIAVSNGPGSYTGIRIGIATSIGLKHALDIPLTGVPLLEAMVVNHRESGRIIAAVPFGRRDICWQPFEKKGEGIDPLASPISVDEDDFVGILKDHSGSTALLHEELFVKFPIIPEMEVKNAGPNLALAVGLASGYFGENTDPQPLYVQNSRYISTGEL